MRRFDKNVESDTQTLYLELPQKPEAQTSTVQNAPSEPPALKTGDADLGTSMTKTVKENPDQFQTDALDQRLNMYAQAASNAGYSLNDRSRTGAL